ncbi:MAG: hypothetical protein KKH94_13920 [Candidatus Omnitrophica bacterium]|nr:hypothetical protein [Candidatus Omnitrophota bacterium]
MILIKLIQLKRKLKEKKDINRLLKVSKIIDYFVFANASFEVFKEFIKRWEDDEKNADSKAESAILGMYANGKICLDIAKSINQGITDKDLGKIRIGKQDWVKHFSNFRNDATAHPINNNANYFSFVFGLRNRPPYMTMQLLNQSTLNEIKSYQIDPSFDIKNLYNYLESLAEIYERNFGV